MKGRWTRKCFWVHLVSIRISAGYWIWMNAEPATLKKLFSFYLFYPMRLPTFALVPRYSVIGQYILLITRAFKDIILILKSRQFHKPRIIGSKTLAYLSLLYLFIGIAICICQLDVQIKGRGLLFISGFRAVESLNIRYINSLHASFIFINHPLGDWWVYKTKY